MKIVIDTNVIAPAIFFGGLPRKIISYLFDKRIAVFVSPEIVTEYYETYNLLHEKYGKYGDDTFLSEIIDASNLIFPEKNVCICRDPDDDKFISCALASDCVYVVSGDKDLLSL